MNSHLVPDPAVAHHTGLVEAVRAAYSAEGGIDLGIVASVVRDDVVLHVPGHHPLGGTHAGLLGVGTFVAASNELMTDGESLELIDVLAGRNHVAVLVRITGSRPDGRALDNHTMHLLRIDADERVAEIWFHNRDQELVDAFWA
jgi:ketosteroid isomerase-like protein